MGTASLQRHCNNFATPVFQRRRIWHQLSSLNALLTLVAVTLAILLGVPRDSAAREAGSGPTLADSQLNVSFIRPGSTRRAEVTRYLSWADSGVREPQLFVARWVSSSEPPAGSGDDEVPDAVRRTWHAHNLMVEFDARGVVTQVRDVPDKRLVEALSSWIASHSSTPLDLSVPVEIPVSYREQVATLLLTGNSFEFRAPSKGCRVSPSDVKRISLATRFRTPQPVAETEAIYFTEKTTAGSKVTLQTDVAHLFVLLKYVQQTKLRLVGSL